MKIGFMGAVLNFEYAPGPFRQEISDIDWVCVTSSETTFPHIRIHDLRQEDSLSFFMSTMASTPAALAIVFVNSENTFRYNVVLPVHLYMKIHVRVYSMHTTCS